MAPQQFTLCAPCVFGLESVLAHEVRRIGGENVQTVDGRVTFTGDASLLARANICLRTAERVCVVLGQFKAETFTELFDATAELPFEQFIGKKDAFPVKGVTLKSKLFSMSDCQAIIKRAAVRRLEKAYGLTWFEETGPVHQIRFFFFKDIVTIMLDASGVGLHKRGYRQTSTLAPIKETIAAGIVDLARVRAGDTVIDPMCGSGTFLIESALQALRIAPGIRRRFAAEQWPAIDSAVWGQERERALEAIDRGGSFHGIGYDIDPEAVQLAVDNAAKAGVGKKIVTQKRDIADFATDADRAIVFCNPPYGERLLTTKDAEELYRTMGRVFEKRPHLSYYIISPHEEFERLFGRVADRRRKLYNGMLKCQVFMYFK